MERLPVSRRAFVGGIAAFGTIALAQGSQLVEPLPEPLAEFSYDQVRVQGQAQQAQAANLTGILLNLSDDSLMRPYRAMAGRAAPGVSLGGWYEWKPDYDPHHDDAGLAPGSTLGQWVSAMARFSASDAAKRTLLAERAQRLVMLLRDEIDPAFFAKTRFPAYTLDKLIGGMIDAKRILQDGNALPALDRIMDAALPSLPGHAIDREIQWKPGADTSWMWDESYTLPENLLLAADNGAGSRYRAAALTYLDDTSYFAPLARGENALADKHAYSYVNALCSAAQMYLSTGSRQHLKAAVHGFDFLQLQSFSTGGWGPDELLRKPGYDDLYKSLTASHNGFETPCGSYAHAKLTRALLRATRDGQYGDSMEQVLFNTTMGALPLQPDGRSFYSADYNASAKRVYSVHRWPCCSGTLPQVVADYGINSYLHEPGGVWVNLYQPSELRWREGATAVLLTQEHTYPITEQINLRLAVSQPLQLALRLRIPAWAEHATVTVNGKAELPRIEKGFAIVLRKWRNGDVVTLRLPMRLRLEVLPTNGTPHPDTASLMHGPLVLFAVRQPGEAAPLQFSRQALLDAARSGPAEWTVRDGGRTCRFVPFTDVGENIYTTYLTVT